MTKITVLRMLSADELEKIDLVSQDDDMFRKWNEAEHPRNGGKLIAKGGGGKKGGDSIGKPKKAGV